MFCEYGCGQEAKFYFKFKTTTNKWCCSPHHKQCPEQKRKKSEANKGRIPWNKGKTLIETCGEERSLEIREKISRNSARLYGKENGMYGRKHSEEALEKINDSCKEALSKPEVKEKLRQANSNENNPNWKGGIACEPYCEIWTDQEFKESIKQRDGYKCLNPECNKTCDRLSIHHIDYVKKNCHPSNLITICVSCNAKANKDREWHEAWYYCAIIERRYCE